MTTSTTPVATIVLARRYLANGIKNGTDKVSAVRALAAWTDPEGNKLSRADVFALIHEAEFPVADNTISRQFHLVRRGDLQVSFAA